MAAKSFCSFERLVVAVSATTLKIQVLYGQRLRSREFSLATPTLQRITAKPSIVESLGV